MEIEIDTYDFQVSIGLTIKYGIYEDISPRYNHNILKLFHFKSFYYYFHWDDYKPESITELYFQRIDENLYSVRFIDEMSSITNWRFIEPIRKEVILDFNNKAKPKHRLKW